MRMMTKRLERESKKAEKEAEVQKKKAADAIKKNQEEGARLYIQNAVAKQEQAKQLLRMSIKLDSIAMVIK